MRSRPALPCSNISGHRCFTYRAVLVANRAANAFHATASMDLLSLAGSSRLGQLAARQRLHG